MSRITKAYFPPLDHFVRDGRAYLTAWAHFNLKHKGLGVMPTVTAEMRRKLADADRYEARMRREHPDAPPEAFALMLWFCVDGRRVAERGPDPLARVGDDAFVDWKSLAEKKSV